MDQANEQSLEDRMMGVLSEEDAPIDEDQPPQQEEQEEEVEQESEQDTPEQRTLKLKRGEEEIEIPEDEAIELAQKGYDYTKKTQEVAEQRKQVEMYAHAIKAQEQALHQQAELQSAFIKELAKVESINDQISKFEQVDWNALSDNDPVQAQKYWIQYQTLQNKRTQAQQDIYQKQQSLQQQTQQQNNLRLEQARIELLKAMPDFNTEKAQVLRTAAKEYGFTDAELSQVVDPRQVKILADAAAYRKLQSEKASVTKKVSGKPSVVKPGAKDTNTANRTRNDETRSQLRKTGRDEYAAKLIERLL